MNPESKTRHTYRVYIHIKTNYEHETISHNNDYMTANVRQHIM